MAIHDNKFLFSKHVSNSELFAVDNIRKEEKIIRKNFMKRMNKFKFISKCQ